MKKFTQAPLPFQGQKRRFLKDFREALKDFPEDAVYIDLFGGSGLLAHTVKEHYPKARVVWNDFDNFKYRLSKVRETNLLLSELRECLDSYPRSKKVQGRKREEVVEILDDHLLQFGDIDFITLSGSLLFGGNYASNYEDFTKATFYNRIRHNDFKVDEYLTGVERIREDYKTAYKKFKGEKTIFLVDPPYLSTDTSSYNKDSYWRLRDYLDVLSVLDNSGYFYFTSNKSQIVELCDWMESRTYQGNPFKGATTATTNNSVNYQSTYTDIMLYKKAPEQ